MKNKVILISLFVYVVPLLLGLFWGKMDYFLWYQLIVLPLLFLGYIKKGGVEEKRKKILLILLLSSYVISFIIFIFIIQGLFENAQGFPF